MRGGGVRGREDGDGVSGSVQRVNGENERVIDELFSSSVQVSQSFHSHFAKLSSGSRWTFSSLQSLISRHAPRRSTINVNADGCRSYLCWDIEGGVGGG